METYTLKDIITEMYDESKQDAGENPEEAIKNYYISQSKNFKDILHTVNLEEEFKRLRTHEYKFTTRGKDFIKNILAEFSGKMDPLRRADYKNADDSFVTYLFEGIIQIFQDANADSELLEIVASKLNNRIDYPAAKQREVLRSVFRDTESLVLKRMNDDLVLGMNRMERYAWLCGLQEDFKGFIRKWDDLFNIMGEIRTNEINELADKEAASMGQEQNIEAHIDFAISGRFMERLSSDSKYRELNEKIAKLRNVPVEEPIKPEMIREIIKVSNEEVERYERRGKKPLVANIEKEYEKLNLEICERYRDIRLEVIHEMFPDYDYKEMEEPDPDFSELVPAQEILNKAISSQKEDWEYEKKHPQTFLSDLPDIDFEELKEKLKTNRCLL